MSPTEGGGRRREAEELRDGGVAHVLCPARWEQLAEFGKERLARDERGGVGRDLQPGVGRRWNAKLGALAAESANSLSPSWMHKPPLFVVTEEEIEYAMGDHFVTSGRVTNFLRLRS